MRLNTGKVPVRLRRERSFRGAMLFGPPQGLHHRIAECYRKAVQRVAPHLNQTLRLASDQGVSMSLTYDARMPVQWRFAPHGEGSLKGVKFKDV